MSPPIRAEARQSGQRPTSRSTPRPDRTRSSGPSGRRTRGARIDGRPDARVGSAACRSTASTFDLTVLGAGPAWSSPPGASGASYLVRTPDTAILLDLGPGFLPAAGERHRAEPLDAVVISHLHPDHFIDLVPLRHYLTYQLQPSRRMRVIAPDGLAGRLDALHADPGFTAVALDLEPHRSTPLDVGDLRLEARRVAHTDDSHAVRLSPPDGPGIVYSGDCGQAGDLRLVDPAGRHAPRRGVVRDRPGATRTRCISMRRRSPVSSRRPRRGGCS